MNTHPGSFTDASAVVSQSLDAAYAAARAAVQEFDPDRYIATLFAPKSAQPHLFALYAFSAEVARVREAVSGPAPGEMRHQWWREALSCNTGESARTSPFVAALRDTMRRFSLPPEPFLNLIEARGFDLYDDPMPTWGDFEGYCGETSSALIRLASLILAEGEDPGSADLCGHAGVTYAITGLLRAFPIHAARGQCYIPHEVLITCGVSHDEIFAGRDSEGLRAALAAMRQRARDHLRLLRDGISTIDPRISAAFYPVCLAEPYLNKMQRADYKPFATPVSLLPLTKFWYIGKGAWRAKRK
jgi:15-cis-phytoene synthase